MDVTILYSNIISLEIDLRISHICMHVYDNLKTWLPCENELVGFYVVNKLTFDLSQQQYFILSII